MVKKNYIWGKIEETAAVGLPYDEKKLIAEFCLDCNTSKKTALEILKLFEDAERIIRKDEKIYSKGVFNEDLSVKEELSEKEAEILNA